MTSTTHRGLGWTASWKAVVALLLGVTVIRLVYLAWWCPYTLIEDEAHYWEWSRRLALSYYSKGPGIAWTIALGRSLFGDTEFGVRCLAPIFAAIGAWFVHLLARRVSGDPRAGFVAAAGFLLVPVYQVAALLMTIDGPYLACWAGAAWAGCVALSPGGGRRVWAWSLLGVALGAGFLYKYTIVLLGLPIAGYAAWLLVREGPRRTGLAGPAVAMFLFVCGVVPVVIWNSQQDWPTLRHLLGHLGVAGGDTPVRQSAGSWNYSPLWTLSYLGSQLGLIGPISLVAVAEVVAAWRRRREPGRPFAEWFLVVCSVPLLLFYLAVTLLTEPEGNWPIAAYVTLLPLAARRILDAADSRRGGGWVRAAWRGAMVVGVTMALVTPRIDLLARIPVVGPLIPIHRVTNANVMANHVRRLADELRDDLKGTPVVITDHYGRSSLLDFYLGGSPPVYCSSGLMGWGRATQYDFWADTNLHGPAASGLEGRSAVLIGGTREYWLRAYDAVEPVGRLEGDGKKDRPAFKAWGFRGFPKPERAK